MENDVTRRVMLAVWANWVHEGWDRPDDDVRDYLRFTPQEKEAALNWSQGERDMIMCSLFP